MRWAIWDILTSRLVAGSVTAAFLSCCCFFYLQSIYLPSDAEAPLCRSGAAGGRASVVSKIAFFSTIIRAFCASTARRNSLYLYWRHAAPERRSGFRLFNKRRSPISVHDRGKGIRIRCSAVPCTFSGILTTKVHIIIGFICRKLRKLFFRHPFTKVFLNFGGDFRGSFQAQNQSFKPPLFSRDVFQNTKSVIILGAVRTTFC